MATTKKKAKEIVNGVVSGAVKGALGVGGAGLGKVAKATTKKKAISTAKKAISSGKAEATSGKYMEKATPRKAKGGATTASASNKRVNNKVNRKIY